MVMMAFIGGPADGQTKNVRHYAESVVVADPPGLNTFRYCRELISTPNAYFSVMVCDQIDLTVAFSRMLKWYSSKAATKKATSPYATHEEVMEMYKRWRDSDDNQEASSYK